MIRRGRYTLGKRSKLVAMKNFDIQLDEEYAQKLAYIQQEADQDTVEAIKSSIELRYQQLQQQKTDPLAKLKQSKFIGCFKGETDLAANSEAIVRKRTPTGKQATRSIS